MKPVIVQIFVSAVLVLSTACLGLGLPAPTPTPVPPTPTPTPVPPTRSEIIIRVIEDIAPADNSSGYGISYRPDYSPECTEVYFESGSALSGRKPSFYFVPPVTPMTLQLGAEVALSCDENGEYYFTDERYIEWLWNDLGLDRKYKGAVAAP